MWVCGQSGRALGHDVGQGATVQGLEGLGHLPGEQGGRGLPQHQGRILQRSLDAMRRFKCHHHTAGLSHAFECGPPTRRLGRQKPPKAQGVVV